MIGEKAAQMRCVIIYWGDTFEVAIGGDTNDDAMCAAIQAYDDFQCGDEIESQSQWTSDEWPEFEDDEDNEYPEFEGFGCGWA